MNKIILGIIVVVALVVGFYLVSSATPTANGTAHTPAIQVAPDFTLEKLGGGKIVLADYKGKKPVILDFWTTWCPNCKRDIPRQNEWYKKYKDQIEVIGIDMQEEPSIVQKFVSDLGVVYPVVLDSTGDVARKYQVAYTNYHVLISKDGNIVGTIPGDIKESDFTKLIAL